MVKHSWGFEGPFPFREEALDRRQKLGDMSIGIEKINDCGCGGLCDSTEPCPMRKLS